jgi:hypothetical protein
LRTFLAILTACAAFAVPLVCFFLSEGIFTPGEDEAFDLVYLAVLLTSILGFLSLFWALIAGGVLVTPTTGLRSHVLNRIRGDAPPAPGGWLQAALIGLAASLPATFASAAIRVWSPASFTEETCWRDYDIADALQLAAVHFSGGIAGWLGLLNLFAWGCLKAFGAERRMHALALAIVLAELLISGLLIALTIPLIEPLSLAAYLEAAAWSLLTIAGAWLYVTRTLEHGLLALMWAPVVILAFRPLWAHLGI